ncbi:MAG: type II glyceraldehyde-3-phosphate dehydrogenase [Aigarchaeota archaeon]|nr:type II glyceraldehyde-3-phosphate dehydrogenase [Candidatus Calditenuis fumarioli]
MRRVFVNGYGVIGRRVADAIARQTDMELIGIGKTKADYKARLAAVKGYRIYVPSEKEAQAFSSLGIEVAGLTADAVRASDVTIDATPDGVGAKNLSLYRELGKPAIFQGGEEADVGEVSFVAECNYDQARGRRYVRVVSCNTTGLCRVINALVKGIGLGSARVVIARRAADPEEVSKGPINAIVLDPVEVPSHHADDVRTVIKGFDIVTMAMKVPNTQVHIHSFIGRVSGQSITRDQVIEALASSRRILLLESKVGFKSTASLIELAREAGRPRGDLYEVVVWRDSISVSGNEVMFFMGVHQEAIVVPENVDAVRALVTDVPYRESASRTDASLGIPLKL